MLHDYEYLLMESAESACCICFSRQVRLCYLSFIAHNIARIGLVVSCQTRITRLGDLFSSLSLSMLEDFALVKVSPMLIALCECDDYDSFQQSCGMAPYCHVVHD